MRRLRLPWQQRRYDGRPVAAERIPADAATSLAQIAQHLQPIGSGGGFHRAGTATTKVPIPTTAATTTSSTPNAKYGNHDKKWLNRLLETQTTKGFPPPFLFRFPLISFLLFPHPLSPSTVAAGFSHRFLSLF